MLGSRPHQIQEARIADIKEAHASEVAQLLRTIDVLAEQVDYLRATGGLPQPMRGGLSTKPLVPAATPSFLSQNRMSEEEEDVRAMAESGLLDPAELTAALADLGIDQP